MAKKLNTTVHLWDDKGVAHVFGPGDELPDWAEVSWADDRDDLWGEDTAPEELSVKEALDQGTPPPDRGPVEQDDPTGRDQQAIELGQEVREAEAPQTDEVKGRGRK